MPSVIKLLLPAILAVLLALPQAFAWNGYDYEKGSFVEIEKGQLVRSGRDVEIYDYTAGEYKNVVVESIQRSGSTVEIEVLELDTGEYRTFEMDGD